MAGKPILKTEDEISLIRKSSLLIGETLAMLAPRVQPGVTTLELNAWAETFIRDHGAVPGFLGYKGYGFSICASVNEAVVHGVPNSSPLNNGDIVSVDIGIIKDGYWGDSAYTFAVGEISPELAELMKVTQRCLELAIEQSVAGKRIGDVSAAVQTEAEAHGYGVVRDLVGHGVGKNLHEPPEVPNYGRRGNGVMLTEGMVIAIEPMINLGTARVRQLKDGWTVVSADGKPSAHFEHTVAVRKGKAEVLSSFEMIEKALGQKVLI